MKVATIKGATSGIIGLLGAGATVILGQAQMLIPAGFGLFFLALMIQYGSIKFKIATSFAALIGISSLMYGNNIDSVIMFLQNRR